MHRIQLNAFFQKEIEVAGDEPMESVNMENNTNMSSSYAGVLKGKTEDTSGKYLLFKSYFPVFKYKNL